MHRVNGCRQEQNGLGRRVYICSLGIRMAGFTFRTGERARDDGFSAVIELGHLR